MPSIGAISRRIRPRASLLTFLLGTAGLISKWIVLPPFYETVSSSASIAARWESDRSEKILVRYDFAWSDPWLIPDGLMDFKKENKMTTKGKVLVLVSSGRGLPLKDGKVYTGAGYYLNELTVPVRALMKEGYEITFANPKGNAPQVDVHSEVADFFGGDAAKLQDYMLFRDGLTGLKNPTRISDVIASGLDQYDAVFVPGGHGPMIDLLDDPNAGIVMRHFHETSKPTAVLCHGPISLLSALPNSKEFVAALATGDAAGAHAKAQGG